MWVSNVRSKHYFKFLRTQKQEQEHKNKNKNAITKIHELPPQQSKRELRNDGDGEF